MKIMDKTKTVEKRVIIYEALDGKQFENESECKEYEKALTFVRKVAFEKVCTAVSEEELFRCGCCDYSIYLCNVTDMKIVNIVNDYLSCYENREIYSTKKRLDKNDIGTIQMIEDCEGCMDILGSVEDYAQTFVARANLKVSK